MSDKLSPMQLVNEQRRLFWESHMEKWERSGLSQAEYCRRNNLKSTQFTYWKLKLSSDESPLEFIQVCAEATPSMPSIPVINHIGTALHLTVNNRFGIDIPDGFSPATLRQVLLTLQEV